MMIANPSTLVPAIVGNKKKKRNSKKIPSSFAPAPTAMVYSGPSRLPRAPQQNDTITTQINNQGVVASSAAGAVTTVFDSYSQVSTPADWSQFANLYTEYRVLSMEIELIPWNKYNTPTTTPLTPLYTVIDRANNTPLASYAGAMSYDSMQVHEPSTRLVRVVKMNSQEEAVWTPVGSSPATASRLYLKLYSAGNGTSLSMYDFVCRIIVQFRGRQ